MRAKNNGVVEAFVELLDSLNFQGYARMLAEERPEAYQFEFEQFLRPFT